MCIRDSHLLLPPLERSFSEQNEFVFRFYIVAPTLGNYHYRLFTAGHSIDPYPVAMLLDTDIAEELAAAGFGIEEEHVLASSEEEFMKLLQFILGSRKTRQLIGVLMSQATGESGEGNS